MDNTIISVRPIQPTDLAHVAKVEKVAWGDNAASPETIARRASVFEIGSIVVLEGAQIVGYAAAQLTNYIATSSWDVQTDNGQIAGTHVADGTLAYGVSMSAVPGVSGKGVAYHVINHYAQTFLGGGCRALCVGSRVPGYARWKQGQDDDTLQSYLAPLPDGRSRDPEVRLYNANGFQLLWGMPDYYPDPKSRGHGAMMVRHQI